MHRSSIRLATSASVYALFFSSAAATAQTAPAPPPPPVDTAPQSGVVNPQAGADTSPAQPPASDESDIVVTGIRQSLEAAAAIKRNADQVVDSIVADDIGKFPDPTVAAALQRVPGVQVTVGDNNEIVNPIIRGLGDILTTLNGREIFTGVGRGFAFQDLPAEALAGADIYKSNSADLLEGGVAGLIDLKLHKAFDFKERTIAVNARGIYAKNADRVNPSVGMLLADRWDTGIGEIGALIDVSYARYDFNRPVAFDDQLRSGNHGPPGAAGALLPTGVGGLNQFGRYERPQINGSLQWQATPELEIYGEGLFAGYRGKTSTAFIINDAFAGDRISNLQVDDNCNDYFVTDAGFYQGMPAAGQTPERLCNATSFTANNGRGFTSNQARDVKTDFFLFAGGFKYDAGPAHVDLDISWQRSKNTNNLFIIDIGKQLPQFDVTTNVGGGVDFSAPGNPLGQRDGFFFTNGLDDDRSQSVGTLFAIASKWQYDFDGILKNIQAGARVAKRVANFQQVIVNPAAPGGPYVTPIDGQGLPTNFLSYAPGVPRIYGGDPFLIPNTDALLDSNVQDQLKTIFGVPTGVQPFDPQRSFYARETTYAGYLQGKYEIPISGPIALDGLIGLRVTKTDRTISGTGSVNGIPDPVTRSTSDTDFLPNASARLKFGGGLQARVTYAKVLSRPDFGSLNPGLNYFVSTNPNIQNGGSAGNPDLRPQKADEYDVTIEYYFGRSNYVAAGVYYKDITGRVVNAGQIEQIGGIDYLISRPRNLGSAKLKGVETSAQVFFDMLAGALSGFGVFGNFTIADSEVTTNGDTLEGYPLLGVSKYSYNAGLLYEKYGLSGRLVYTHRSSYFDGDATSSQNPRPVGQTVFLNGVRPYGRLDFSVNYDVTPNITLSVDGTNINRSKYRSYKSDPAFPQDIRFDDSLYSVGVRFKF